MSAGKIKIKKLRIALAGRGITTIAEFARSIERTRPAIYMALRSPESFPFVTKKIQEVMGD